ncbi:TetR/AcrR family transcriptional regulator [Rhodococcus sp. CX]|uniref:TetR/AcrR family transcriptional regulator n=1 Tax=Rhodococcus sp. CX TaxID=2789880 RepID=UPI0018CF8CCE|nr:TetR/AcrR family transcriptional regulator [Rhodococcus sp. CX]MBH0119059.1 TetR/AcrR family transcriptional regulator [Rhodococcus sp. CX]
MGRPKNDARRRELLAASVRYAQERGLFGLTLRPLADELGTSTRNLLHHFGSREELISRIVDEVLTGQLEASRTLLSRIRTLAPASAAATPTGVADVIADGLELAWTQGTTPEGRTRMAMFFEIYAASARDDDLHARFVVPVVSEWVTPMVQALEAAGVADSRSLAHRILAVHRGLLLQATVSGPTPEIESAHRDAVEAIRNEIVAP